MQENYEGLLIASLQDIDLNKGKYNLYFSFSYYQAF
jgi:hypothetical protein